MTHRIGSRKRNCKSVVARPTQSPYTSFILCVATTTKPALICPNMHVSRHGLLRPRLVCGCACVSIQLGDVAVNRLDDGPTRGLRPPRRAPGARGSDRTCSRSRWAQVKRMQSPSRQTAATPADAKATAVDASPNAKAKATQATVVRRGRSGQGDRLLRRSGRGHISTTAAWEKTKAD